MNIPNSLTLIRILFVPVFINLMIYHYYAWALAVFVVAGITDALDGLVARATNQRSLLGSYLDPLADKLLLSSAFLTLGLLKIIPIWASVIVVSRDVILFLGALILHLQRPSPDLHPSFWGKATTAIQIVYIGSALFQYTLDFPDGWLLPLFAATMVLTIYSGFHYLYRGLRVFAAIIR